MHKGGSIASDSVTGLVNSKTYMTMDKGFSNDFGSHCGGKKQQQQKQRQQRQQQHAGGLSSFLSSATKALSLPNLPTKSPFTNSPVFRSQPAMAMNATLPRNSTVQVQSEQPKMGGKKQQRGGQIKTMTQLLQESNGGYKLFNKQGGKHPAGCSCCKHGGNMNQRGGNMSGDLSYDHSIKTSNYTNNYSINRGLGLSTPVLNLLSGEGFASASPALTKTAAFGSLGGNKPFSYSGVSQAVTPEAVTPAKGGAKGKTKVSKASKASKASGKKVKAVARKVKKSLTGQKKTK